jgi:hypothetical protein
MEIMNLGHVNNEPVRNELFIHDIIDSGGAVDAAKNTDSTFPWFYIT